MARAAVRGRLNWTLGEVVELTDETPRVRTIFLEVPEWPGHRAGQHVDVRLTAEDGYQAQRSYSIASAPEDGRLAITVERLPDGEVSEYLVGELRRGDMLELRGPIGGYFVWEAPAGGPLYLCAGGSGIAPFMAVLEHRERFARGLPTTLLYSVRSPEVAMFAERLDALARADPALQIVWTYTRAAPQAWQGYTGRVDAAMLRATAPPPDARPLIYVCGPTSFVELAATSLVGLGYKPGSIWTERFGPSG